MADSKQNDCLDGVPSPFMADSKQSSGFDGVANTLISLAPKTNFLALTAAKSYDRVHFGIKR